MGGLAKGGREPSGQANTSKEATEESACRTHRAGRHKPAGMSVQGLEGMARQAKTKQGRHRTKTRSKGGRRRRLMQGCLSPIEPARTGYTAV
eukprot:3812390-Pleurochrysis_carterae.AAC.1